MNSVFTSPKQVLFSIKALKQSDLLHAFLTGLLLPLGFAPFHFPLAALLGLAILYAQLNKAAPKRSFFIGLFFGLGYFGLGISWIFISIHEYGHLNHLISAIITLCFLLYLSLFPALMARCYSYLNDTRSLLGSVILFSALWVLFEYLRASFLGGFPWLILGFGQFDTPLKYILPILGVYGAGFISCFAACLLAEAMLQDGLKRYALLLGFILILFLPMSGKQIDWSEKEDRPLSVGIIQANLSMRDKWDESLFWTLLARYQKDTEALLGTDLIVMPESAIPLPVHYLEDYFNNLHKRAKTLGSAVLLGIPQLVSDENEVYYNSMFSLGKAKGSYLKQHLVPFGEYMPGPIHYITRLLSIPDANLKQGESNQPLIRVKGQPIASLICYELAYGDILRQQLPIAKWIVSISDDGWFGHSFAIYQQQQMAQVRSLQTARYQVVSNNDGLSSIIDPRGEITDTLPAFSSGILKGVIFPVTGSTPWIQWGDKPILLICFVFTLVLTFFRRFNYKLNQ